jgi:hypothetical protein
MKHILAVALLLALVLPARAAEDNALLYVPVIVWADKTKTKTIAGKVVATHTVERKEYVPVLFCLIQRSDGVFEWFSVLEIKADVKKLKELEDRMIIPQLQGVPGVPMKPPPQ